MGLSQSGPTFLGKYSHQSGVTRKATIKIDVAAQTWTCLEETHAAASYSVKTAGSYTISPDGKQMTLTVTSNVPSNLVEIQKQGIVPPIGKVFTIATSDFQAGGPISSTFGWVKHCYENGKCPNPPPDESLYVGQEYLGIADLNCDDALRMPQEG